MYALLSYRCINKLNFKKNTRHFNKNIWYFLLVNIKGYIKLFINDV